MTRAARADITRVGTSLRALIIDDQQADAQLLAHELRRAGFDPVWTRVDHSEQFLAALNDPPQVILCDYCLSLFDPMRALAILRDRDLEIPLIVVSGRMTEDQIVSAVKAGAEDCLVKDRPTRLGPIVRNALERQRLRRGEADALRALRESEELFRCTFEQAAVGVAHVGLDGRWLRVNNKLCEMFGYDAEELVGRLFIDFTHADDRSTCPQRLEALAGNAPGACLAEHRYLRKDGSILWANMAVSAVRDPQGDPRYFVTVLEDITANKKALALEQERSTLRASVTAMEQVLGIVGHELRTPLAGLRAMSEFLQTEVPALTGQAADFVRRIHDEVVRMSDTVDDLLETARINAGRVRWNWSVFGLAQVCAEAVEGMRPLVDESRVRLLMDVNPPDAAMRGDADAVRRLVLNLLSNARKFTADGSIELTVNVRHRGPGDSYVELRVRDTGTGIAPDVLPKLGEPFGVSVPSPLARRIQGTGLGLAICKRIIGAHGGTFAVDSALGRGTTISVYLRADLPQPILSDDKIRLVAA